MLYEITKKIGMCVTERKRLAVIGGEYFIVSSREIVGDTGDCTAEAITYAGAVCCLLASGVAIDRVRDVLDRSGEA